MIVYVLAFGITLLLVAGMSVGLMVKGRPLSGSCGGVARLMGNDECELCGGNPNKCEEYNASTNNKTNLSYDASASKSKGSK